MEKPRKARTIKEVCPVWSLKDKNEASKAEYADSGNSETEDTFF